MASKDSSNVKPVLPTSILTKIAGGQNPLLPGESAEEYSQGLQATIAELEAKTPIQIYLAEKIFDCMWWIRRLEAQKTQLILDCAWGQLKHGLQEPPDRELLTKGNWTDEYLVAAVDVIGHTVDSLISSAMQLSAERIRGIDGRIADRIKAMQGLQVSYEALVNRKLVIERLQLQNENLRRDLMAIEARATRHDD